jgi:TrmH family RNA methyltransferase
MSAHKITSLQHAYVKHLVKLRENRDYRYRSQSVVVCGLKLIKELSSKFHFSSLLLEEGFHLSFTVEAENLYHVTPQIIKKISGLEQPEPIAAEIEMPKVQDLSSANFLLILDGISDPGNLGTLLRNALGLGWDGVFLTSGSADPFNDKALRAAKGATFMIPWKSGPLEELKILLRKKNRKLYAADMHGKDLSNFQFSPPLALALGNEAHGLTSEIEESAEMIAIPMQGRMESLNVASAGAIMMYEIRIS